MNKITYDLIIALFKSSKQDIDDDINNILIPILQKQLYLRPLNQEVGVLGNCPSCQSHLPFKANYCSYCGQRITPYEEDNYVE